MEATDPLLLSCSSLSQFFAVVINVIMGNLKYIFVNGCLCVDTANDS